MFSNIETVTLNEASQIIEALLPVSNKPVFLHGPFGIGKSAIIKALTVRLKESTGQNWGLIEIRASQIDSTDTRGIPDTQDRRTFFATPDWLPRVERDGEFGIVFLDELLLGSESTQRALYQFLEGLLGDYELPIGWRIIAASNRPCDGAGVRGRHDAALMTRFETQLNVTADPDEWKEYAVQAPVDHRVAGLRKKLGLDELPEGFHPFVVAFMDWKGKPTLKGDGTIDQAGLLLEYPDGGIPRGHTAAAQPRGWHSVSNILYSNLSHRLQHVAIAGAVGVGPAATFMGFLQILNNLPDANLILRNPDSADVPSESELGTRYAIATTLAQRVTSKNIDNAVAYIKRMHEELLSVFFLIATNRDPNLQATQAYINFKIETQSNVI